MENACQRVNQTTVDIMRSSRVMGGGAGAPGQYGMPQQVYIYSLFEVLSRLSCANTLCIFLPCVPFLCYQCGIEQHST